MSSQDYNKEPQAQLKERNSNKKDWAGRKMSNFQIIHNVSDTFQELKVDSCYMTKCDKMQQNLTKPRLSLQKYRKHGVDAAGQSLN